MKTARETQEAFWYERADTQREFLKAVSWNSLQEGTTVGGHGNSPTLNGTSIYVP